MIGRLKAPVWARWLLARLIARSLARNHAKSHRESGAGNAEAASSRPLAAYFLWIASRIGIFCMPMTLGHA